MKKRPSRRRRALHPWTVALAAWVTLSGALGQTSESLDQEKLAKVKAAFLLNFAKFTTWPASGFSDPKSPIVIGVLGDDSFGGTLEETIKDKQAQERTLVARRYSFTRSEDVEALRRCHILYVAESENVRWKEIQSRLGGSDVLVVGESAWFAERGGMVAFVLSDGRVVFHINRTAVEQTRLQISSKLFKLAPVVHGGHPEAAKDP